VIPFAQTRPDDPMFAAWTPETWYESRAQQLIDQQDAARSQRAIAGARLGGFPSLADRLERDQALDRQRRTGAAELQRAQQLLAVGSDAEARRALERATEADPSNALAWAILANQRRMVQDIPGAEAALAHIHSDAPLDARVQAAVVRGILDMMQKRPSAAAARFAEARVLNPKFTSAYIYEAEAHAADGDSSAAKEALRRGLAVLPNDPALLAKLGSYR
jgi:Tfp pilus assembly protein PilF